MQPSPFSAGTPRDLTTGGSAATGPVDPTTALLDTLFSTVPLGLAYQDRELRFVRINHVLAAFNGLPAEAHLGRTMSEILPHLAATVEPVLRRVLDTGEPVLQLPLSGETPAAPGRRRHWLASYHPVRAPDGRVVG